MRYWVEASIKFLEPGEGGRSCMPIGDGYAPYIRTESLSPAEDLPIRVYGLPVEGRQGVFYKVKLECMYHPKVNYSSLTPNLSIRLMEGPKMVAQGQITSGLYEGELQQK